MLLRHELLRSLRPRCNQLLRLRLTLPEFAFPQDSRTPNQIGIPHEGAFPNKNSEKLGDSYTNSVEDTNMLKAFFLMCLAMYGTFCLSYVQ